MCRACIHNGLRNTLRDAVRDVSRNAIAGRDVTESPTRVEFELEPSSGRWGRGASQVEFRVKSGGQGRGEERGTLPV